MYITLLFSSLEYFESFFISDIVAHTGLFAVICEVAETHAPILLDVSGTLASLLLLLTAGAYTETDLAFILFEPIRNMLNIKGLTLCRDSLLYRDDVHSDTVTALADHLSDACKRQICHALKEICDLRSLRHDLVSHDHDLCSARYEHIEHIASLVLRILAVFVFVVPFNKSELTECFKDCLKMCILIASQLLHLCECLRLTLSHHKGRVKTVLCDIFSVSSDDVLIAAVKSPVLRRILGWFLESEEDFFTVSNDLSKLKDLLIVCQFFCHILTTSPFFSLQYMYFQLMSCF